MPTETERLTALVNEAMTSLTQLVDELAKPWNGEERRDNNKNPSDRTIIQHYNAMTDAMTAVAFSFDWKDSQRGYEYWDDVHTQLRVERDLIQKRYL